MSVAFVLALAYIISFFALMAFIWVQRGGFFRRDSAGARVIFAPGEVGHVDDPAGTDKSRQALQQDVDEAGTGSQTAIDQEALALRAAADQSVAPLVLFFYCSAIVWLLVASSAGLTASIKLHAPDWLVNQAWLSFGNIRTIHLNAVAYGWTPFAGLGTALFIIPRLLRTPLMGMRCAYAGGILWNIALVIGLIAIAKGWNGGKEWLEIPWQIGLPLFGVAGLLVAMPLLMTLVNRREKDLYVSIWYMGAALFWFPVLYITAQMPGFHANVEVATMNWWFGHNVLGLFYTPVALGCIYYFLPKIIGRPIQSYNLSLVGFWALAFFYGQVGGHHLVGGPVPEWMITLSIVQSMMMIIPVLAFSVNMGQTLQGHYKTIIHSPTLRFVAFGGLMYFFSSVQGSFEALRSVNVVAHFTHFTVAHAHLGLYAFVAMAFFGSMYFVMPRITGREWPYPKLISAHFWLTAIGIMIYFLFLTYGGWLQGMYMLDAAKPFIESVKVTMPYLKWRSVGGGMMTLGHLIFALHFFILVFNLGPKPNRAAMWHTAGVQG